MMVLENLNKDVYGFLCQIQAKDALDEYEVLDILQSAPVKSKDTFDGGRWYDIEEKVVEIGGKFIRFLDYHTTGDDSPSDMGLEPMMEDICFVIPQEKLCIVYVKANEEER